MKKILTVTLCLSLSAHLFSNSIEFNSSVGFTVPVDKDKRMVRDISEIKWNYGLKLNLGQTVIAGNAKLGSLPLIELHGKNAHDYLLMQEYTYGIWYSDIFAKLKVDVLAGNLRYSGGISRLKTPFFSCPSPHRNSSFTISGITVSLPSASSSKNTFSWSAAITPKSTDIFLPSMQIVILDSGEKYGSLYRKFSPPFIREMTLSFTAGTFFHEYCRESGWFQNERYYNESDFFSSEISASLTGEKFKTLTVLGIYENPFGGTRLWLRNQCNLSIGFFQLGMYHFNADEDIITASGNNPRIGQQIFLSPKFNFKTRKGIAVLGATFGRTKRNTKERMSNSYSQYDLKLGSSYTTMRYHIKGNYDYSCTTETGKEKTSAGIDAGINYGRFKSSTGLTVSIEEDKSRKYKITEKFYFKKQAIESISAGLNWTKGKENEKWNFDTAATFSRKTKHLLLKGKINFSFRKVSR